MQIKSLARPKILIAQAERNDRQLMKWLLRDEFDVMSADNLESALKIVRDHKPKVILLDIELCQYRHLCTIEKVPCFVSKVRGYQTQTKIIIITNHVNAKCAAQAMRNGAFDSLLQPVEINQLRYLIWRTCWHAEQESRDDTVGVSELPARYGEMIGDDERIRQVFVSILKIAPTDVPVLITGETGTGKELAARAIHNGSPRKHGPFVSINCGAIPENLIEAELFGYEKGAYTGAWQQKKGKIEFAQKGTLFLDEIGELPLALQVKLLRFLDDRRIERIGGRQKIDVDTRVVAATNINPQAAILQGKFREDLYYRLAGALIVLPPLRDRGNDVLLMARVFLNRVNAEFGKKLRGFSAEAVSAIKNYRWPGNVRELLNKIRSAGIMAEGPYVTPNDLQLLEAKVHSPSPTSLKEARRQFGADLLAQALTRHNGDIQKVAKELKISRPSVYYLLNKHQLRARTGSN